MHTNPALRFDRYGVEGRSPFWAKEACEVGYRVAVVGPTGNVGREMLAVVAEREGL